MKLSQLFYEIDIEEVKFKISLDNKSNFKTILPEFNNQADTHYHVQYECFIFTNSVSTIHLQNKRETYKNKFVIIPPFLPHHTISSDVFTFVFSISTTSRLTPFAKKLTSLLQQGIQEFDYDSCSLFYIQQLSILLSQQNVTQAEITSLLYLFFVGIFKSNNLIQTSNIKTNKYDYLTIIESYIFNNFDKDVSLEDLANELHLSTRQLSRILQTKFKKSFSTLISDRRLEIATYLLLNTSEPISKIIENTHLNNESYFYRLFKKKYGCTPTEYRKKALQKPRFYAN